MKTDDSDQNQAETELCPNCGSPMVTEDGQTYCLKCASEIDWAIDDEEEAEN